MRGVEYAQKPLMSAVTIAVEDRDAPPELPNQVLVPVIHAGMVDLVFPLDHLATNAGALVGTMGLIVKMSLMYAGIAAL